ncbi:MAG TPA: PaaI family thioesterase [Rhizomicrobium sp.]|jgi:uncharacterized protein (TIGR00369 family)|nr:PaaI family thioesterase [Rhizomicrobium sp.]
MSDMEIMKDAGNADDPDALMQAIPYCRYLGIRAELLDGALRLVMPFAPHLVGNPLAPSLHGGVLGALLETAAIAQVLRELKPANLPKPIDITVDYMRVARNAECRARAHIIRHGRRVANVEAEMWQDDETKPVASLRGHFLLGKE